jgi:hypothetical protein
MPPLLALTPIGGPPCGELDNAVVDMLAMVVAALPHRGASVRQARLAVTVLRRNHRRYGDER